MKLVYAKCNIEAFDAHMIEARDVPLLEKQNDTGVYVCLVSEDTFREEFEGLVAVWNYYRESADSYDVCEDFDPITGVTTLYVMCEDGSVVMTFPIYFGK